MRNTAALAVAGKTTATVVLKSLHVSLKFFIGTRKIRRTTAGLFAFPMDFPMPPAAGSVAKSFKLEESPVEQLRI